MAQLRDVAIVGAGLVGLSAARALAARGRDVVVLEKAEIGNADSGSKGRCRIFRLGYPDPVYVRAAQQAGSLWRELEAESGTQILWPVPQLTIGTGLRTVQDAMITAGARCELLTAEEAARRFPAMRVGGPALLEPDSAVIAADAALAALAARPADIRTGVRVTRLSDDGRQVTLRTTAGPVTARVAIVTAGPWSGGLLAALSVPVPGRATLEQVAYLEPADPAHPPSMPIFIAHAEQAPYGLPVPGSPLFKIGIHQSGPAIDPDAQDPSPDPWLLARLADTVREYLPALRPQPAATERCVYDNTPDEDFIVDRVGQVVIGCGTSGHGFKFGPLLGEWLADLADGQASAGSLAGAGSLASLDPQQSERFAVGRFRPPA